MRAADDLARFVVLGFERALPALEAARFEGRFAIGRCTKSMVITDAKLLRLYFFCRDFKYGEV